MRAIQYEARYQRLLTPEIVAYVASIHELKGSQALFAEGRREALAELVEVAKIQSTEASNRIEGIVTTSDRLKKLALDKTTPRNRDEWEIAGYRDVLATIHENHDYVPVRPNTILQLHRDLCMRDGASVGGRFKIEDNSITETRADGTKVVRFGPVPAWETPAAMDAICDGINGALGKPELDPLLLTPLFVLDFLCVHPFSDGNGRMSRLLTLLLLYRAGHDVGKYVSLEKLIADSKESYYDALKASSAGWHEGENDDLPFVRYMLGVVAAAYREFSFRTEVLFSKELAKPDRVREIIRGTSGRITKAQIMELCPNISMRTIQRALSRLQATGEVLKIGDKRYASYVWNREMKR